ncbi:uncharacterized protein LOC144366026 [Ictidomys tridecemlineatus]
MDNFFAPERKNPFWAQMGKCMATPAPCVRPSSKQKKRKRKRGKVCQEIKDNLIPLRRYVVNTANPGRMDNFFAPERKNPFWAQMGKCMATPAPCVRSSSKQKKRKRKRGKVCQEIKDNLIPLRRYVVNTANPGRMDNFFAPERKNPFWAQMGKCMATPAPCVRSSSKQKKRKRKRGKVCQEIKDNLIPLRRYVVNTANPGRMDNFFAPERKNPFWAQMGKCMATPAPCVRPSCK